MTASLLRRPSTSPMFVIAGALVLAMLAWMALGLGLGVGAAPPRQNIDGGIAE